MIDHVVPESASNEHVSTAAELSVQDERAAAVDVDDVTMLLRELRLVQQLRRAAR